MQRASRRASGSDSGSSQRVRLGLWLPGADEARFWTSDFAHRDKDNQAALIHVFHALIFLLRLCSELPAGVRGKLRRYCGNSLALDLLHLATRFAAPQHFAECRWILVVHRRLYAALVYVASLQAIARVAAASPAAPSILGAADFHAVFSYHLLSGAAVTPVTLLRSLLIGCCALWNLIHALPFPIPLPLEAAFQAVYLWTGFYYMAQTITSFFSAPRFAPAATSLCRNLTSFTQPAWIPLPAAHPSPAALCGTPQRMWVLVLFLQLYGALLTLFLSYLVERHLKLRFLQHLCSTRPAAASSPPPAATTTAPSTPYTSPLPPAAAPSPPPASTTTPRAPHAPPPPPAAASLPGDNPPAAPPLHIPPPPAAASLPGDNPPAAPPLHIPPPATAHAQGATSASAAAAAPGQASHSSGQAPGAPHPTPAALPTAPTRRFHWHHLLHPRVPDLVHHPRVRRLLQLLRSLCTHVLVLWLLAAVAWNLVVACRIPLARTLTPMPYRGAHLEWYWELMREGAGGPPAAPQ